MVGPGRALASSPIFKAECKAPVIECGPPNSVPWGSVADGSECLFSLALCSFPRVLTHFVVIRYRCFTQLSLKIQVYCEIEVSHIFGIWLHGYGPVDFLPPPDSEVVF